MKTITVFTPTFNRKHLLPQLYNSLCRQSSNDFIWLVIDDGSSDNTNELIKKWQSENKIEIEYHYKENGGMHTAHNLAYKLIETELNVCIDSDDYMPDDAIDKILSIWKQQDNKSKLAGIIGLDADKEGNIIGSKIPSHLEKGGLTDLYKKHKVTGDKKIVLRTDVVKEYPLYPEFKNERLVPLGILYLMISQNYEFIYSNEVFCIVEYQAGGSSATIFKQYLQSPRGFAYARTVQKKYSYSIKDDLKNSVHIGVSSLAAKDSSLLKKGPKSFLNYMTYPLALVFYHYLSRK